MDKERLPSWAWMLVGLLVAAFAGQLVYALVLFPMGVGAEFMVIPLIGTMSIVVVYIHVWYEEENQYYWEHSRAKIAGDVGFVIAGAVLGASMALVGISGLVGGIIADVVSMFAGFILAWGMMWWRNPGLYSPGGDGDR